MEDWMPIATGIIDNREPVMEALNTAFHRTLEFDRPPETAAEWRVIFGDLPATIAMLTEEKNYAHQ
jgi:hypothetical protein